MLSGPARNAPPALHWGWLLFLSFLTSGTFLSAWAIVQAYFVQEIDPGCRAMRNYVINLVLAPFLLAFLVFALFFLKTRNWAAAAFSLSLLALFLVVSFFLWFSATFGMRRSLLYHYNSRENCGLRLGPVMTFFFSSLYFQYHFNRISRWQQSGLLH